MKQNATSALWNNFSTPIKYIFLIQLLSIISFSSILYTMGLYLTEKHIFFEQQASQIIATYAALNFFIHWVAGYLSDRWIQTHHLLLIGLICQVIGGGLAALHLETEPLLGFAIQLCGNGLCITCINCLLSEHLPQTQNSTFRQAGFLWNYSAMNIGFFLGLLLAGYYQLTNTYTLTFFSGSLSSTLALLCLFKTWKYFNDKTHLTCNLKWRSAALPLLCVPLILIALKHALFSSHLILLLMSLGFVYFVGRFIYQKSDTSNLRLFLLLSMSALIFWTLYQLTPITLIFFIQHHVNPTLFGLKIAPQWFENINTLIVIIGAPLLAHYLSKPKTTLTMSLPLKFASALGLISFGLLILLIGIYNTPQHTLISPIWMILKTTFESLGELLLAPIGIAAIALLVPSHWRGMAMGSWLMLTGAASALAGELTHLSNIDQLAILENNLPYYMHTLFLATSLGILGSFILLLSSPEFEPKVD